jgi:hypothetical protein
MTEHTIGLLTPFQRSASDTPTRHMPHLSCDKASTGTSRFRTNCRQVQHWTEDLLDRLDRHAAGHGARLVQVIWQAGIGFTLVRVSEGTRHTERAIKNAGGAVRYCPSCPPGPATATGRP